MNFLIYHQLIAFYALTVDFTKSVFSRYYLRICRFKLVRLVDNGGASLDLSLLHRTDHPDHFSAGACDFQLRKALIH